MTSKRKWIPDPKEAIAIQRSLAAEVQPTTPARFSPRVVAGVDVSYDRFSPVLHAGVVVVDLQSRRIVESVSAVITATFPYIPGLLSFREAPAILRAWEQLQMKPDLVFVDGNGIAHPRRLGIAAHLGITWKLPTIGCAKSRLIGRHRTPGMRRGASVRLMDGGEIVGSVVRTRDRVAPVYVSVGNLIDLDDARRWVLKTTDGYRLPRPIRLAHDFVNQLRRSS